MDVDFTRIRQKTVKRFMSDNGLLKLRDFKNLKPANNNLVFRKHTKKFLIKENSDVVWNMYKNIAPKDAWNGSMVSFGLQYSRRQDKLTYNEDHYSGMEKGQIIFLHLNIYGLLSLAVAHEVTEVNEVGKFFTTTYMEHGKSAGTQHIQINATKEGYTEIIHKTLYKSDSPFRDKILYPALHTKAITEFHENVKRKVIAL
jgi:hypothetical protein